ncbi:MAG: phosphatase PAP2 family protein, partial [Bacteroidia bacterium]
QSKKLVWILMIIQLIISYSRFYLGFHYVSDVLTGMIFGLIAALISLKFLSFLKGRFNV